MIKGTRPSPMVEWKIKMTRYSSGPATALIFDLGKYAQIGLSRLESFWKSHHCAYLCHLLRLEALGYRNMFNENDGGAPSSTKDRNANGSRTGGHMWPQKHWMFPLGQIASVSILNDYASVSTRVAGVIAMRHNWKEGDRQNLAK